VAPALGQDHERIVGEYFAHIRDLRAGNAAAVDRLMELWDSDGTFEFSGAPPLTGTYHGRMAIRTLYKNRLNASGMQLRLHGATPDRRQEIEAALGAVETDVNRTRVLDEKIVAGWTTTIGTREGQGFQVSGSHTFTFKDGKILSLRVVASPKADMHRTLRLEGLGIDDIGRLTLAAWAVV
jgi:ketosteroid isomerase-like protein